MKALLLGLVAATVAGQALAADIPVKAMPAVVPAFSWTGCHVGGHVGGLWGQTRWTSDFPNGFFIFNQDVDFAKVTGGAHLGCYYQYANRLVVGAEIDFNLTDVDKFGFQDPTNQDEILLTKFRWFGTARGILGYAFDRWLVFGTGGLIVTDMRNSYENYTDATRTVLQSRNDVFVNSGWTAGGGLAYAWTNNWIIRAEYLFAQFEREQVQPTGLEYAKTHFHTARLGLSYKFGGAPIVARY